MFNPFQQLFTNVRGGEMALNGAIDVVNREAFGHMQYDPGLSRPYIDAKGRIWVDVITNYKIKRDAQGSPVMNSGQLVMEAITEPQLVADRMRHRMPVIDVDNANVYSKDQWILLDSVVREAVRPRLRAWSDLRATATMGGIDGMATPILEYEIMTDNGEAMVDMEGIEGRNFTPNLVLQGLPLPITHCDFHMSERFRAVSRARGGQGADVTRAGMAGRRCAEMVEKTLIGTQTGVTYGDSTGYSNTSKVYGYTNHPDRITYTSLTASSGITGEQFLTSIQAMIEAAYAQNFFGPFNLYVSPAYDAKLGNDFKAASDKSTRSRLLETDNLNSIKRLDYLTGDVMILVQMQRDVVQAVNGMEFRLIQWSAKGNMQHMFKVMGIQVPFIQSVFKSGTTTRVTGIVHGTTS